MELELYTFLSSALSEG